MRIGTYAKYGIDVEALCTQGTGETQQAVIAGSTDIGIGVGTLGALGAFAKGAPIRIVSGSATGNADFDRERRFAAQGHPGRGRHQHRRLFYQRGIDPQRGARLHPGARPRQGRSRPVVRPPPLRC